MPGPNPSPYRNFQPDALFPSTWARIYEELLRNYASANFELSRSGANVRVVAGAGDDQRGLAINGHPRYITATATVAGSGAAGTYRIWAITGPNAFSIVPVNNEQDNTDTTFGLKVTTMAATPTGTGAETYYRLLGTGVWDGSAWTALSTFVGREEDFVLPETAANSWKTSVRAASTADVPLGAPGAAIDGVALASGDRVLLKNQTTATQNGVYVWTGAAATLQRAADADTNVEVVASTVYVREGTANAKSTWTLTTAGAITLDTTGLTYERILAPLASPSFTGVLTIDSDVNLYRSAANVLNTDDSLVVAGSLTVNNGLTLVRDGVGSGLLHGKQSADTELRFVLLNDGSLSWGPGGVTSRDTNLYRSQANTLKTDDDLRLASPRSLYIEGTTTEGIHFGSPPDTSLYREGGGGIRTDGNFRAKYVRFIAGATGHDFYSIYVRTEAADIGGTSGYGDKLHIRNHGGIKYDAYSAGGGHRFYTAYNPDGSPSGKAFSVGENDNNVRVTNTLYAGGSPGNVASLSLASDVVLPQGASLFLAGFTYSGAYIQATAANRGNLSAQSVFRFSWDATGIGFYGANPVAKPNVTGGRSESAGEPAGGMGTISVANDITFGNLLTALASLGLITNSTTA